MSISRRKFIVRSGLALASAGLAGVAYMTQIEPHWVEYTYVDLNIPQLPATLRGKTLVQLSDLHIGPRVSQDYMIQTFEAVKGLEPDIVVYTGDFVSYDDLAFPMLHKAMAHAPTGSMATLGVLGNHDYGPGWNYVEIGEEVSTILAQYGIQILNDETVEVQGLKIGGIEEFWSPKFEPSRVLDHNISTKPDLVLCHNPEVADLPIWGDFKGWILSGHTHGGQIRPPFLPPPVLPVANKLYSEGQIDLPDGRTVYINRGLGHLLKARFNARPEVTIFTLKS